MLVAPSTDPAERPSVRLELGEIAALLGDRPETVRDLQVACLTIAGYSQRDIRARLGLRPGELAAARARIGDALLASRSAGELKL